MKTWNWAWARSGIVLQWAPDQAPMGTTDLSVDSLSRPIYRAPIIDARARSRVIGRKIGHPLWMLLPVKKKTGIYIMEK